MSLVFDLDDLCDEFDPYEELVALKGRFPGLKVTLFAIPGRCSPELLERYRQVPWVELAVHGYHHAATECVTWGYAEANDRLEELEVAGWMKLFKAPGWLANEEVYQALQDRGWAVADNIKFCELWGDAELERYVYNANRDVTSIHGHTWDTCENGPSAWCEMFEGLSGEFKFVSEAVGPTPPKTYLWEVLDDMALSPGDLFVDCGAYDGAEIEVLQPMGVQVLSFEPHPDRAAALAQRWGGVSGVEFIGAAVGVQNGEIELFESAAFDTGSTTEKSKVHLSGNSSVVPMLRLADLLRGRKVKVLKLDIEGTEWEVLKDLLEEGILQQCEMVYVEDHENRMRDKRVGEIKREVLSMCREAGIELREWV